MMICKHCKTPTNKEYIFEDGKSYQRYICPLCRTTTDAIPIMFDKNGRAVYKNYPLKNKKNRHNQRHFNHKKQKENET